MKNSKQFLTDFYLSHKDKYSSIKSSEYIIDKAKSWFNSGRWSSPRIKNEILEINYKIVFGLESGIIFTHTETNNIGIFLILNSENKELRKEHIYLKEKDYILFDTDDIETFYFKNHLEISKDLVKSNNKSIWGGYVNETINILEEESFILKAVIKKWFRDLNIVVLKENEKGLKIERKRLDNFNKIKNETILKIDKNNDGKVDFIDSESYDKLLSKNQKDIIEIDKNYIQKFVKISIYLKTKKNNTQKIFESINSTNDDKELTELVNLLKNQIHTYDLLVFHSISMMISLIKNDLISFYEIYECFDQLGVFNSNWENEVSDKLTDIGSGINELMHSIYNMENKIVSSIDNLTYVTKDSFRELSDSVEKQLTNIDSTIKFNNFLNVIQTYQMYKINKNTKRLS